MLAPAESVSPTEFTAWVGSASGLILMVARGASWVSRFKAAHTAERRAGASEALAIKDGIITDLRSELEREQKITLELTQRAERAERERWQMENLLYRFGFERTKEGWKRNGETRGGEP